jgi:hypothetical protein
MLFAGENRHMSPPFGMEFEGALYHVTSRDNAHHMIYKDDKIVIGFIVIDIPEGPRQRGYAKAKVEVRQLLDGSWRVYYKNTLIAHTDPTPLKEPIRAKPRRKSKVRATSEEQWIYMASAVERGHFYCTVKGTYLQSLNRFLSVCVPYVRRSVVNVIVG